MSWKPTFWLLALVVITGLFIVVFEKNAGSDSRALPVDDSLLHVSSEAVTRLAMTAGDVSVECVRRDGQWFLTRPMDARANEARINRIIEALVTIHQREILSPERLELRRLTTASFGLDTPRVRLLVGNELRVDEVVLGDDSPLGDLVYLRLNGGKDVIGATCQMQDILPIDVDSLRDRSVFSSAIKRAVRLELKYPGVFLQLALRDGNWRIQQPLDARADNRRVERLLLSLMALKIESFGSTAPADPFVYGLGPDEAAMQISLFIEGGKEPLVLTVGKARQDNPALLYAGISDVPSLCAINKEVLALQAIRVDSLRDRRLCDADPAAIVSVMLREGDAKLVMVKTEKGNWMIMEPFRFKADSPSIGTFLRTVCDLKIEEGRSGVGTNMLDGNPSALSCRLDLATVLPSNPVTNETGGLMAAGSVWSYLFYAPLTGASNSPVYSVETKTTSLIHPQALAALWPKSMTASSLVDPRFYMDCQMLDLSPGQVRRITLAHKGREETVTFSNEKMWLVDSPPDGQIVEEAIPSLLGLASTLRAERIESMNSTNALMYGIDESSPRVTFGLTGASGIQKTVLIGRGCEGGGVYAMIQGQDVVFVLRQDVAQALTHRLVETR
ncbi:MAG: DUF4340 domain-containing protein [bacterium]